MARQETTKVYNKYVAGLVSDATVLNFPENASVDEQNFILERDGSRSRRLGLALEQYETGTTGDQAKATVRYVWKAPRGDSSKPILVIGTQDQLEFYKLYENTGNDIAEGKLGLRLHPSTFSPIGFAPPTGAKISFTEGEGRLFIFVEGMHPLAVYMCPNDGQLTPVPIPRIYRDMTGVEDSLSVDERPSTLTDSHKYNLHNQGWTDEHIALFKAEFNAYPSNADIHRVGVVANPTTGVKEFKAANFKDISFGTSRAPRGKFFTFDGDEGFYTPSTRVISADITSSSISSVGGDLHVLLVFDGPHGIPTTSTEVYIHDGLIQHSATPFGATLRGLSGVISVDNSASTPSTITLVLPGLGSLASFNAFVKHLRILGPAYKKVPTAEYPTKRVSPATGKFFNGRLFHSTGHRRGISFSQVVDSTTQVGYLPDTAYGFCFQGGDPTSEYQYEIVATDGGFVSIPEMGVANNIETLGNSLLTFTTTGVREIKPSRNTGYFTPTSFNQFQVTESINLFPSSLVKMEGAIVFLSESGINVLTKDRYDNTQESSITDGKVFSLYQSLIEKLPKNVWATLSYNPRTRLLEAVLPSPGSQVILRWDAVLQAFYKFMVAGVESTGSEKQHDIVTSFVMPRILGYKQDFKYVALRTTGITSFGSLHFADMTDTTFTDFKGEPSESDAEAFIVAGTELLTDPTKSLQSTYLWTYMERTEKVWIDNPDGTVTLDNPSSCYVRARWGFGSSPSSGKWSSQQQAYKKWNGPIPSAQPGGEVVQKSDTSVTKRLVRGEGKAVSFEFTTTPGKDCKLIGWAVHYTQNMRG